MYRGVGDGSNIYYMYYHPEIDPVDLAFYQYENIIVPHAIEVRNRLIEEDVKGFVGAEIIPSSAESEDLSASYTLINESHPSREEVEKRLEWICIAQDGAIEYLEAVMSRLQSSNEMHGRSIINMKYAAGCSLSESPNDTGTMHMCLQGPACYGGDNFKYGEFTEPEGIFFSEMRQCLLTALQKSDFDTVWPAIHKASQYLPKAFNHMSCKNAFTQGGIVPYNRTKILSKFDCYRKLNEDQVNFVFSRMPMFKENVEEGDGRVMEETFKFQLQDTLPGDMTPVDLTPDKKTGKQLKDMAPSRQRAMICSNPKYLQELREKKAEAQQKADAKKAEEARLKGLHDLGVPEFQKSTKCSNPLCDARKPKVNNKGWKMCKHKGCNVQFCDKDACLAMLMGHQGMCPKAPVGSSSS